MKKFIVLLSACFMLMFVSANTASAASIFRIEKNCSDKYLGIVKKHKSNAGKVGKRAQHKQHHARKYILGIIPVGKRR